MKETIKENGGMEYTRERVIIRTVAIKIGFETETYLAFGLLMSLWVWVTIW